MQKTLYTLEICPCFVEGQVLALGRPTRTQREPPSPLPPALRDGRLGFFWFPRGLWTAVASASPRGNALALPRSWPLLAVVQIWSELSITFQTTCTRISSN